MGAASSSSSAAHAARNHGDPVHQERTKNAAFTPWAARRASDLGPDGDGDAIGRTLSTPSTAPRPGHDGWLPTGDLPCSALGVLVRNGLAPDNNVDTNLAAIPDIYHAGRAAYTFWWCACFTASSSGASSARRRGGNVRRCRLSPFGRTTAAAADDALPCYYNLTICANYECTSFVNGVRVSEAMDGMFMRHLLRIPPDVIAPDGLNAIAILVRPPIHVGCVDKGGQGGDHSIARDVTAQFTEGWDWTAPTPVSLPSPPCIHASSLPFHRISF